MDGQGAQTSSRPLLPEYKFVIHDKKWFCDRDFGVFS